MTRNARIVLLLASLSLIGAFVFPIWTISLEAPQYPEGIGLLIDIDSVRGQSEHDLNNINNLNHYIGMKRIEPDAIPELRIMPWVMAFLLVFGVAAAAVGKRPLLYIWVFLFITVSIVGMVDFWLWEYDYGHNLDMVNAIIKIPGMSYQPPLIGSKKILNFTAHSWPGAGGWMVIASAITGFVLAVKTWRTAR